MAGYSSAAPLRIGRASDDVGASTTVTSRLDWDEQADDAFSFADLPDELRGQATYKETRQATEGLSVPTSLVVALQVTRLGTDGAGRFH